LITELASVLCQIRKTKKADERKRTQLDTKKSFTKVQDREGKRNVGQRILHHTEKLKIANYGIAKIKRTRKALLGRKIPSAAGLDGVGIRVTT